MTTFDDREAAVEAVFAHHQERLFKARAHGVEDLAAWAASELGKSPDEATIFVEDLIATFIQDGQVTAILAKVRNEFAKAGRVMSVGSLMAHYDKAVTKATVAALKA